MERITYTSPMNSQLTVVALALPFMVGADPPAPCRARAYGPDHCLHSTRT